MAFFPWTSLVSEEMNAASLTSSWVFLAEHGIGTGHRGLCKSRGHRLCTAKDISESYVKAQEWYHNHTQWVWWTLFLWFTYAFTVIYFNASQFSSKAPENLLPWWKANPEFLVWQCSGNNLLNYLVKQTMNGVCVSSIIVIISIFSKCWHCSENSSCLQMFAGRRLIFMFSFLF